MEAEDNEVRNKGVERVGIQGRGSKRVAEEHSGIVKLDSMVGGVEMLRLGRMVGKGEFVARGEEGQEQEVRE